MFTRLYIFEYKFNNMEDIFWESWVTEMGEEYVILLPIG